MINCFSFHRTTCMFSAVLVNLKRADKGAVKHKEPLYIEEPLTTADFGKLYLSNQLDMSSPEGFKNKIFVDVVV